MLRPKPSPPLFSAIEKPRLNTRLVKPLGFSRPLLDQHRLDQTNIVKLVQNPEVDYLKKRQPLNRLDQFSSWFLNVVAKRKNVQNRLGGNKNFFYLF